ncbi:MAG: signal recognition particle-docking protein FtsY [Candidatus Woesearchaeota archaeon]
MFKFLKDKLKSTVKKFSQEVDEESDVVEEKTVEEPAKKKPSAGKKKKAEPQKKKAKKAKEKEKPSKPAKKKTPQEKTERKKEEKREKEEEPETERKAEKKEEPEEKSGKAEKEESEDKEEKEDKEGKGFFRRFRERFTGPAEKEEIVEEEKGKEEPEEKEAEKEGVKEEEQGKPEEPEEKEAAEEKEEAEPEKEEAEEEKKGFFGRVKHVVTTKALSEDKFEKIFWDLELALLESNVAVEAIEKIKEDLRQKLVHQRFRRSEIEDMILSTLKESIGSLFDVEGMDLKAMAEEKKPLVIAFVGVNGSGKTTSIAKVAHLMKKKGLKPVIAAADTFRAAAIQQLEEHGNNLGVKVIKHDYGSDPAAVAFDAIKYAESKGLDLVLIDTAGRQHSNMNLVDEMKKIVRVAKPDIKVFVGESITGNDCIEQAKSFNEAVGVDGIILTKADVDDKGGAAVSVSYVTGKPILYLGMGQGYDDLKEFDRSVILENLGL